MVVAGVLVFRLIADGQQGRANARGSGIARAAGAVYATATRAASLEAGMVARELRRTSRAQLAARLSALVSRGDAVRITVRAGPTLVGAAGVKDAVAPGLALLPGAGARPPWRITVSQLTAQQLADVLEAPGIAVVVRQQGRTLGTTLAAASHRRLPRSGAITLDNDSYGASTSSFGAIGPGRLEVTALSDLSTTPGPVGTDRLLSGVFIGVCLAVAFWFLMLRSKALDQRLPALLAAARRLRSGDLSAPIPTTGSDGFAALGEEFNSMSLQLADRLDDLDRERARLRQSIRRIGEAFAANLDRVGILELALKTAMDATGSDCGRVSAREHRVEPLVELAHFGSVGDLGRLIYESERRALGRGGFGELSADDTYSATVALGAVVPGGPTHGLITVCRSTRRFGDDERELLRSLAARATLALANVNLHFDMRRQAVTDDLTGLATHGHFQELLAAEMVEVRRYQYSVGLIMIDIDDFKSINDLYGHQQGDVVLRHVAEVLLRNSRDPDVAARYGGEEFALILPHTDLDGTYAIAERIRESIEQMEAPLLDGAGSLQITASAGAAAAGAGSKNALITAADSALYAAKRAGKNRTVKAHIETANVVGGE